MLRRPKLIARGDPARASVVAAIACRLRLLPRGRPGGGGQHQRTSAV